MISISEMSNMIHKLEDAIRVCYNAEEENEYPYATGYSRVVMKEMVIQLKELMNEED